MQGAEQRALKLESDLKLQNDQAEELYNQMDSLQDCINSLETERTALQTQLNQLRQVMTDNQRSRIESELKAQTAIKDKSEADR